MKKVKFIGASESFTPFGVMKPGDIVEVDEKYYDIERVLRGHFELVKGTSSKKEQVKKSAVGKKEIVPAALKSKEE